MALILWDGAGIYVFTTVVKKALQLNVKPLTAELSQVGTCGKEAMVFVCFGSLCGFPPGLWVFKHIWTKRLYKWKLDIKVNTDLQLSVLSVGRVFLSWIPLNFLFMNESSNCCGSKYDTLNPQFWSWVCMGMGLCEILLYFYFFLMTHLSARYLQSEWEVRRGSPRDFGPDQMKSSHCHVPLQDNSSDCGLYLLQYVECFLKVKHFFNVTFSLANNAFKDSINNSASAFRTPWCTLTSHYT